MKKNFILLAITFISLIISCKRPGMTCEGYINGNKLPIAIAGPDQVTHFTNGQYLIG